MRRGVAKGRVGHLKEMGTHVGSALVVCLRHQVMDAGHAVEVATPERKCEAMSLLSMVIDVSSSPATSEHADQLVAVGVWRHEEKPRLGAELSDAEGHRAGDARADLAGLIVRGGGVTTSGLAEPSSPKKGIGVGRALARASRATVRPGPIR